MYSSPESSDFQVYLPLGSCFGHQGVILRAKIHIYRDSPFQYRVWVGYFIYCTPNDISRRDSNRIPGDETGNGLTVIRITCLLGPEKVLINKPKTKFRYTLPLIVTVKSRTPTDKSGGSLNNVIIDYTYYTVSKENE